MSSSFEESEFCVQYLAALSDLMLEKEGRIRRDNK